MLIGVKQYPEILPFALNSSCDITAPRHSCYCRLTVSDLQCEITYPAFLPLIRDKLGRVWTIVQIHLGKPTQNLSLYWTNHKWPRCPLYTYICQPGNALAGPIHWQLPGGLTHIDLDQNLNTPNSIPTFNECYFYKIWTAFIGSDSGCFHYTAADCSYEIWKESCTWEPVLQGSPYSYHVLSVDLSFFHLFPVLLHNNFPYQSSEGRIWHKEKISSPLPSWGTSIWGHSETKHG